MIRLSTRHKIAIARGLNRTVRLGRGLLGKRMQGQFRRNGLNWALDLDEGIDFAIYLLGAFEWDLIRAYRRTIRFGATVLDIGANIGAHTLPLADHVGPDGQVIAIEATAYAVGKLQANLALNPALAARVHVLHCLLTETDDAPAETAIASSWPLSATPDESDPMCGAAKSVGAARHASLDTVLRDLPARRVDWIKLDVDGHELSVLRGAKGILARDHPGIFMELAPYCYAGTPNGFADLVALLAGLGYRFHRLPSLAPLPTDAAFLGQSFISNGGSINILAMRKTITG